MSPFSPQSTSATPLYLPSDHRQVPPSQSLLPEHARNQSTSASLRPSFPLSLPRPPSKTTTIKLLDLLPLLLPRSKTGFNHDTKPSDDDTNALPPRYFSLCFSPSSPVPTTTHTPLRLNLVACPSSSSLDDPHSYLSPAASTQPYLTSHCSTIYPADCTKATKKKKKQNRPIFPPPVSTNHQGLNLLPDLLCASPCGFSTCPAQELHPKTPPQTSARELDNERFNCVPLPAPLLPPVGRRSCGSSGAPSFGSCQHIQQTKPYYKQHCESPFPCLARHRQVPSPHPHPKHPPATQLSSCVTLHTRIRLRLSPRCVLSLPLDLRGHCWPCSLDLGDISLSSRGQASAG